MKLIRSHPFPLLRRFAVDKIKENKKHLFLDELEIMAILGLDPIKPAFIFSKIREEYNKFLNSENQHCLFGYSLTKRQASILLDELGQNYKIKK